MDIKVLQMRRSTCRSDLTCVQNAFEKVQSEVTHLKETVRSPTHRNIKIRVLWKMSVKILVTQLHKQSVQVLRNI